MDHGIHRAHNGPMVWACVGKNVTPQILSTSDEYFLSLVIGEHHISLFKSAFFVGFISIFDPKATVFPFFFWGLPLGLQRILFFRALSPPKLLGRLEPMVPRCWCCRYFFNRSKVKIRKFLGCQWLLYIYIDISLIYLDDRKYTVYRRINCKFGIGYSCGSSI